MKRPIFLPIMMVVFVLPKVFAVTVTIALN